MTPLARRLRGLGHPVVVGALVVLALNDHVLKRWSVGRGTFARTATGKASDLAGVLLLALLVGALSGRRRVAVVGVGAAFIALKLSPDAADLAAPVLGGRTRSDPWDLLALAALLPAWSLLGRTSDPAAGPVEATGRAGPRVGLAVLVLSVPVVTATSAPFEPCVDPDIVGVLVREGDGYLAAVGPLQTFEDLEDAVRLRGSDGRDRGSSSIPGSTTTTTTTPPPLEVPSLAWYRSDDGRDWAEVPEPAGAALILAVEQSDTGCTATACFTVHGSLIEQEEGGEETYAEVPEATRSRFACARQDEVLVTTEEVAVSTDGESGLLRWTEADHRWERVAVGPVDPAPERYEDPEDHGGVLSRLAYSPVLLVLVAGWQLVAIAGRRHGFAAGLGLVFLVVAAPTAVLFTLFGAGDPDLAGLTMLGVTIGLAVVSLVPYALAAAGDEPRRP